MHSPTDVLAPPRAAASDGAIGPSGEGLVVVAEQIAEFGGMERILTTLLARLPAARLVASRFGPADRFTDTEFAARLAELEAGPRGDGDRVRLIGSGNRVRRHYLFPLYARELRGAPLGDARAVLTVGGLGWAHGVEAPPGARHVAYVGGPPRPLYGYGRDYRREYPPPVRPFLRVAAPALRAHHRRLLAQPDAVAANSRTSAAGMEKILRRPVEAIYPTVRVDFFTPAARERRHHLLVSRLRPHKRADRVIEAFRQLGEPLVVAGQGPWLERLRHDAPPNVRFAGHVGDEELRELMRSSRAVVSASVEEFGLALVEALATGTPIVAPRAGGSGEIVADGVNGAALDALDPAAIAAAVERLEREPVDPDECRRTAERFSGERFTASIRALIEGTGDGARG